jgi:hypothetical protein
MRKSKSVAIIVSPFSISFLYFFTCARECSGESAQKGLHQLSVAATMQNSEEEQQLKEEEENMNEQGWGRGRRRDEKGG